MWYISSCLHVFGELVCFDVAPLLDVGNDTEESGWKMVSGDVFRPPKNAISLCVQIGSGVQIITSAFATLFFAALGEFLAPQLFVLTSDLFIFTFCHWPDLL